jgi:hypothetical protein
MHHARLDQFRPTELVMGNPGTGADWSASGVRRRCGSRPDILVRAVRRDGAVALLALEFTGRPLRAQLAG